MVTAVPAVQERYGPFRLAVWTSLRVPLMRMNQRDLPLHSRFPALLLPCLALSLALALPALADPPAAPAPPPTEGAKPAAPAPAPAKKPGSDKPKKLTRAEE